MRVMHISMRESVHRGSSSYARTASLVLSVLFACISVCSYAQVRLSFYGDTLKGDIKKMTEYNYIYSWEKSVRFDYTCDVSRGMEVAVYCEADNKPCVKWLVRYDKDRAVEKSLYNSEGQLCHTTTYKYDGLGRVVEQTYVDSSGGSCNALGDYLDGAISNWAVGADQRSRSGRVNSYQYDAAGHIVKEETRYFGSEGTQADITEYKYDSKGNKVEARLLRVGFDWVKNWYSDGKEITSKDIFTYDTHNNLVEDKGYFVSSNDNSSAPHAGKIVGGGSEYIYDSLNNRKSVNFYRLYKQEDGSEEKEVYRTQQESLMSNVENGPEEKKEYDDRGNVIKKTRGGIVLLQREIEYF